ncbi:MAG TPA: hypothetical protein PKD64_07920 [Pirellulaceae bacterium]|nr:hypothetical protein [Pirellulaceae bacterium]HMO92114.1 hypothetical protein [Pirellulaceae bacterium]HMP69298.1 hypothetical protein [Pirellulaceae bacterium]
MKTRNLQRNGGLVRQLLRTMTLSVALLGLGGMMVANVVTAQESAGCSNCGTAGCAGHGQVGGCGPACVPRSSPWESYYDVAQRNPDGSMIANCVGNRAYPSPVATAIYAARDPFHPRPIYAYGPAGIDATRTHTWNYNQGSQYAWHGGYYHRQWGQPLALVVPPTAAFQSQYSWGVGQTKSLPIYHQFLRPDPGASGGAGGFSPTPYWPSNTQQFGVYPVRGPW